MFELSLPRVLPSTVIRLHSQSRNAHPTRPTSPYGLEKLTLDHYSRLYHDLYGLETVALRVFQRLRPRPAGRPLQRGDQHLYRSSPPGAAPRDPMVTGTRPVISSTSTTSFRRTCWQATTDAVGRLQHRDRTGRHHSGTRRNHRCRDRLVIRYRSH
ncbi:MAG: NAD-dependent epimerase/dehydratase family protein [Natrialbaceae archaeon]|nr:NAD-dependent epimerase/dehydratase family protein [Natrialbaceae archaeon]